MGSTPIPPTSPRTTAPTHIPAQAMTMGGSGSASFAAESRK